MEQPKVSILMLNWNRSAYIHDAIDSVISQTYRNWELFVLDDGSTDDSRLSVANFSDMRIHFEWLPHVGVDLMRKNSSKYACGKYVAILDSDDLWHDKRKLERQVDYLEEHSDCAMIGTFTRVIDIEANPIGNFIFGSSDDAIRRHIMLRNQFTHSAVLMRTELFHKAGGYKAIAGEDLDLFMELGKLGKFANIPEQLTSYRTHSLGMSRLHKRMALSGLRTAWRHKKNYPNSSLGIILASLRLSRACARELLGRK